MPSQQNVKRKSKAKKKTKKYLHRPPMVFHFSVVVAIFLLSLIGCFAYYMVTRNLHPELADDDSKPASSSQAEETSSIQPQETEPLTTDANVTTDTTDSTDTTGETTDVSTTATSAATEESQAQIPAQKKVNPVPESTPQPTDYLKKLAFVGDSNIYRLKANGLISSDNTYSGETLNLGNYETEYFDWNGTELRVLSIMRDASCPIYLMFGTDTLIDKSVDENAALFSTLLNRVKAVAPDTDIYVLSIPPITAEAEKANKISNSDVDTYNSKLLETANEANVYFIDTNTALKNNSGKLSADLAEKDGMHLNVQGESIFLTYILNHIPVK